MDKELGVLQADAKYILGFNETDHEDQANMSNEEILATWPAIMKTGKRTVSPASCNPNDDNQVINDFINSVDADEAMNCDSIALHYYSNFPGAQRAKDALANIDAVWEKYHKPIWLTEVSIRGASKEYNDNSYENKEAKEKIAAFMKALVEGLEERDYVERYAWFSYNISGHSTVSSEKYSGGSALFDYETGGITPLGELYASLGNPKGYKVKPITNKYASSETQNPTTEKVTTKAPEENNKTTQPVKKPTVPAKPTKVKIKQAKNVKKKSVTLKWTKATKAKKYQVQYSLNKKFKPAKKYKTKTVTTSKLQYTVKKLAKKKTYYFRVRGVNGKAFGAWSNSKRIKIKK